jgi:hypothetical protein
MRITMLLLLTTTLPAAASRRMLTTEFEGYLERPLATTRC